MKKVHAPQRRAWWKAKVPTTLYSQHPRGDIVCCDGLSLLHGLKEGCADIIFLDPPFNLGKSYARNGRHNDRMSDEAYLRYIEQVLLRSCDVLRPGGALYLYHIPRMAMTFGSSLAAQLELRHWIAISMKNGFVNGEHLYPAHYALLYFTKGKPGAFHRPKLPLPRCRKCDVTIKDYGGYKRFVAGGINLSDYWDDISPVRHRKYKNRPANELPLTIPLRAVQISGRRHGVLVDPFAGAGSALIAALRGGMRFVASDREREACRVIRARLKTGSGRATT